MDPHIIPIATYRLQFSARLTLAQAKELIPYLHDLGISHCYASPLKKARPGSTHGYDVTDYSLINPEIGTATDLEAFVQELHQHNMGLICDIIPNHMYIGDISNRWWYEVLENGPSSPFAGYFDIDWHSPREELVGKVLLPLLDQQYGEALENQTIRLQYREGSFSILVGQMTLPTDPCSWPLVLDAVASNARELLPEDNPDLLELQSIITGLSHLPATTDLDPTHIAERQREKEVIKKRLHALVTANASLSELLTTQCAHVNGTPGDPASFDALELFLNAQPYRLCFWRVANDEINFRRFFDIFEYAGICTEKREVFDAIHVVVAEWISKGYVAGLRVDHIDGLLDPEKYLANLHSLCPEKDSLYLVVEKILVGNEKLRKEWPVEGTVGYDFLNNVNGLFVHQQHRQEILDTYRKFTGATDHVFDLIVQCKQLVLLVALSSELYVLARLLYRIARQHRSSRDFTEESLRASLRDVIACFPVYRSYIRVGNGHIIREEDRQSIQLALTRAKRSNPAVNESIYNFLESVLLLEHPQGLSAPNRVAREEFVLRFQQLTGPVMAKGLEDTALYRFYPLASLNEVGADPYSFGISIDTFHKKNSERAQQWPHAMLATSTHDTKRSEDTRARINVLSEIPTQWAEALNRWQRINASYLLHDGDEVIPDPNEEYLLYQTLIGTWPLYPMDPEAYVTYLHRIQAYMEKAIREAKLHTSWINPNKRYEEGVLHFIQQVLTPGNAFLEDFARWMPPVIAAGLMNSISQVLLKLTSPGVPDLYQGSEVWDFSLVDPDNRRPVDFHNRSFYLQGLQPDQLIAFARTPQDGRIKLFVTQRTLQLRHKLEALYASGSYVPLHAEGERADQVIAFARVHGSQVAITIATRFFFSICPPLEAATWKQTHLVLPKELQGRFSNGYTGREVVAGERLPLDTILDPLPIALLERLE